MRQKVFPVVQTTTTTTTAIRILEKESRTMAPKGENPSWMNVTIEEVDNGQNKGKEKKITIGRRKLTRTVHFHTPQERGYAYGLSLRTVAEPTPWYYLVNEIVDQRCGISMFHSISRDGHKKVARIGTAGRQNRDIIRSLRELDNKWCGHGAQWMFKIAI